VKAQTIASTLLHVYLCSSSTRGLPNVSVPTTTPCRGSHDSAKVAA